MNGPSFAEASAFVTVLEQKSFTKAAKLLGLSTPRVSEIVRHLEERLGARLVERTTRSVAATVAGEHLLHRLRSVIADYQAALESTSDFLGKPAGALRLTVSPPAADFILIPAVSHFLRLYPEITLDISINSASVDLVAEHFDAGIRQGDQLARDMIAVRIGGKMPIVVAAAPAYLACFGEPKTPHDLAAHNCIRYRTGGGAFWPWRFRVNGRVSDVHAGGRLIINDRTSGLKAAIDGVGLTQMPLPYLASELIAGRLVTVLDEYAPPPVEPLFLYYSSRRYMRPALKALLVFLRAMGRDGAH